MAEKLAQRSGLPVSVTPPEAAQSRNEKSGPKLEWGSPVWTNDAKTHGYVISLCERYMLDRADGTYTAYRRATTRDHRGIYLGYKNDAAAAKSLCETDAQVSQQANGS